MSTIDTVSDNPKFTIKNVAIQTGILPVTLRAWERRHDLLSPHRSENKYRLYSERDIAILRWIKSRVDTGLTISSAVDELHTLQRNNVWPEAIPAAPEAPSKLPALPTSSYVDQLSKALMRHDEVTSDRLIKDILASYDLMTICLDIFVPSLIIIGEAWYRGEIRVTTEHFASAYLRGKLLNLFQTYPTRRSAPFLLVGCGPNEQHEIGSLMIATLLRSQGYRVEYLGPDIPIEDLVEYARYEKPAMVILSASTESTAYELRNVQEKLSKLRSSPVFGYGGGAFNQNEELQKRTPGYFLGNTLDTAITEINSILKTARKSISNS